MQYPLQMVCPHCGTLAEGKFCKECGAPLQQVQQLYAPPPAGYQQPYAGKPVQYQQPPYGQPPTVIMNNQNYCYPGMWREPKDKWVAFLLCFFLGVIGIHKFYEGKIGMGILYIFTGGLFGIGWLVDWICILCKPNPYYV